MAKHKILVVDDEESLCEILQFNLEVEGYEADVAYSAEQALRMHPERYSLILLDVMMGEMSGFRMAQLLKADPETARVPVIFCTAKDSEDDTVAGLNIGADDYITKPFSVREVLARVRSVLRRTSAARAESESIRFEGLDKQKVELYPNMCVTNFTESEQWDTVIEGNDDLLEKYMSGKSLEALELEQEESIRFQNCSLFPLYHGSAKSNIGIDNLIEVITNKFYSSTHRGPSELCGNVFKIEYTKKRQRLAYIRLYSGVLHLRDSVRVSEKDKIKVTEMYTSINGELCKIDRAYSGEIVILQNEFLKLNSVLGDTKLLPQRKKIENPHPLLQTTVEPSKPEQREMLLDALLEISDSDPLLRYYVDSTTHEIILSFLGKVQMEVISALLQEKYHVEIELKEPTVIYMERPLKNAEYTIHIEVPPNPFWASIGLSVSPLPLGSGMQYESSVSLGYLNQSLQNAVMEGIRYGCEQGLYGWNVTDCKICFKYGLYYSPVSTPADFRMLAPIVLEQVLKKAGTELLEPYLSFKIYAPQEYLSRAYNDAPKYCANIVDTQLKNNEVILSGEIPARCIQEYRSDLTFFTNGRSVCLTELKGYHVTTGEPVCQPRRPNSRIDKVRYMFNKIT